MEGTLKEYKNLSHSINMQIADHCSTLLGGFELHIEDVNEQVAVCVKHCTDPLRERGSIIIFYCHDCIIIIRITTIIVIIITMLSNNLNIMLFSAVLFLLLMLPMQLLLSR